MVWIGGNGGVRGGGVCGGSVGGKVGDGGGRVHNGGIGGDGIGVGKGGIGRQPALRCEHESEQPRSGEISGVPGPQLTILGATGMPRRPRSQRCQPHGPMPAPRGSTRCPTRLVPLSSDQICECGRRTHRQPSGVRLIRSKSRFLS